MSQTLVCDTKADGSQSLDLQQDALRAEGVEAINLYHDLASGVRDDRPGLDSCLRALRTGAPCISMLTTDGGSRCVRAAT